MGSSKHDPKAWGFEGPGEKQNLPDAVRSRERVPHGGYYLQIISSFSLLGVQQNRK